MLPTQSSESLVIKMFGSERGRAQTCDVVRLGVRTRDGTHVHLKLLVVPSRVKNIMLNRVASRLYALNRKLVTGLLSPRVITRWLIFVARISA